MTLKEIKHLVNYIYWRKEAQYIKLTRDEMIQKLDELKKTRTPLTAENSTKTRRLSYTNNTYRLERKGDWYTIYLYDHGDYFVYSSNDFNDDCNKRAAGRTDIQFDNKFRELNNISLRKAFGFVPKEFKRNISKSFYYMNENLKNYIVTASSIDASSQYPSGCLGKLPDSHTMIIKKGIVKPTEEYPFVFYKSGHLAIYNELDTHEFTNDPMFGKCLIRCDKDQYPLLHLKEDEEESYLMKASKYTMDSTWEYFYNIKNNKDDNSDEYEQAKLIMNSTIGQWHRKDDRSKTSGLLYDNGKSYQLAHIAAIAIARGNKKILDKAKEIGKQLVLHICVDGIIYLGDKEYGQKEKELGKFKQEFTGCDFRMTGMNVYAAEKDNIPVKFKHGSYDQIYGHDIEKNKLYDIDSLDYLTRKARIREVVENEKI